MLARSRSLWIASGLFVLSGLTGLTYETIWFKRLGHTWGSSSLAMASVVATFLCGLGIGAWLFGRWSDRARAPLAWYGWCEIGIGALALAIPFEIGWLAERVAPLSVELADTPLLLTLTRFALTFVIIGPPCVLMGATLPLLTRQFAARGLSLGGSTAWLYASNTLGAALGAGLAGFFALEHFGLQWTNGLAVVLNIAVGIGALAVARRVQREPEDAREATIPATLELVDPRTLRLAALATGFASIGLQMLWAREVALLVGATTYAFSATVFVFILGLGLGSLWFRARFSDAPRLEPVLVLATVLIVVPALVGSWFEADLALLVGYMQELRIDDGFNALLCASISAALEFLPTVGMGLLFPALVQLSRGSSAHAGRAVGGIYAWNTLGSIGGAGLTALVLLPAIGGAWSLRALLAIYALVPVVLLGARPRSVVASVACLAFVFSNWSTPDPLGTNLGLFLYGPGARERITRSMKPVYFQEGASCNVLVLEGDRDPPPPPGDPVTTFRNLRVNGKIDASTSDDMSMQVGIAYIPRFLRPRAKSVCVIGMGSGATAGASALFPDAHITVCEIEPAVNEAARWFTDVNHGVLERDNVTFVEDDGRSFVQGHPGPWDLILSEPSNPWIAGVANLFTEEFYRTAQRKLARDGVLAQWVQTYSFSAAEYALVVRTVTRVFPHALFFRISHFDTLVLASNVEILPRREVIDEAQRLVDALPAVAADLTRYFETRDVRSVLLAHLFLDERGLASFVAAVGGNEINTDLNMRLEFAAPRRLFHERGDPGVETMRLLLGAVDASLQQRLYTQWNCGIEQLGALKQLKTLLLQHANLRQAGALIALALAYDGDDPELTVDRLLFDPTVSEEEFGVVTPHVIERSPAEALRLARQLAQMGQHNAARVVYERLTEMLPTSSTAYVGLAGEYAALGRAAEAEDALAKARELDPLDDALLTK